MSAGGGMDGVDPRVMGVMIILAIIAYFVCRHFHFLGG